MDKKISVPILLLLLSTLILAACRARTTPSQADCSSEKVLCVGLVSGLDGIEDKSSNQSAWEGVLEAHKEKLADRVQFIETVDAKDYDQNIAGLAESNYDIIVTVGDLLGEATAKAAKSYPDLLFIGVDQQHGAVLPNLVALMFHDDQAGFLAGALAAQLTKTDTIAVISGSDMSSNANAYAEGFAAGARFIKPDIDIITTYYPSDLDAVSADPLWGADAAAQAIQKGADVIFGFGGKTGEGALIKTASYPDAYCIGADSDQWGTVPEAQRCLVSSATKLIKQGVSDLIKLAKEGSFPSGSYYGNSGLAPFHNFEDSIPRTVRNNLSQIMTDLNAGAITTGYNPAK